MRRIFLFGLIVSMLSISWVPVSFAESDLRQRVAQAGASPYDQQRTKIRTMAQKTLSELYAVQPGAQQAIKNAQGYAVFSNFGMKILVAGGGKGAGIAVQNKTGRETFMKMVELQAGLGIGVKQFRLIWVFDTFTAFDSFVNSGWTLGAQATAAAQIKDVGGAYQGAIAVSPGVWLYQLTDNGLALELTAKGTKYYKDKDLNKGLRQPS
ncbi:MAG TPA: YSC84-related protein [Verrucomicrobiae bacterium]|jgi:lipid-binding SYLF domain-containing protein|nr:YSC84-related protein [Verrucomicrobiae bacterium]